MNEDAAGFQSRVQDVPDAQSADADSPFQALHEIVAAAHAKLDPLAWDYLVGGSETETTLKRNRHALDSLALRPRILRDVSSIDTSSSFFGTPTSLPVALCPVGSLSSFHDDGAAAVARAATKFGVPVFVSSAIQGSMESVARAAPGPKILQLYTRGDRAWIDDYVVRAKQAGYGQLCLTVDSAVSSRRERDIVRRFVKPWSPRGAAADHTAAFAWDDVRRIRVTHGIPVILKGIATAEDADLACREGAEAVHVSNHGGRALDHGRGAMEVLPEVVAAVAGRAKIIVDGGFSRGTDVIKALALGADTVGIGRLYLYGLAAGGEAGVLRVLQLLEAEIRAGLGLLGVTRPGELLATHVQPAHPVTAPHVLSAFPLLPYPLEARSGDPSR